ncbi:MAG: 2-oxoisovalerate dehydrogenase E1 subunit beta [Chitinophagaceae bacterium]|jgi:predicted RNase H-like HicB family nuclease
MKIYLHGMQELLFIVTESPDGGFTAHCSSTSIHTEAETMEDLKNAIIEAVHCHIDDNEKRNIRLQIIKEEFIAA